MNKEQCRVYLTLSDAELKVIKLKGLVKHRKVATEWVASDYELQTAFSLSAEWNRIVNPVFKENCEYRLKHLEKRKVDVYVPDAWNSSTTLSIPSTSKRVIKNALNQQIINAVIREENEKTGYVTDWDDASGYKYFVVYVPTSKKYTNDYTRVLQQFGTEYCSKETACKVVKLLNNNMIEGLRL